MLLTKHEIISILRQETITDEWPWSTNDEKVIHRNIKKIVAEIRRKNRLRDKTEFGHYGSGYASFVDCWLYREDEDFRFETGNCYWGLVVLFSTLSKYYVVGEGQKTWHKTGGSSYLPTFQFVDQVKHPATQKIEKGVCNVLNACGLLRLNSNEICDLLPKEVEVPTILSDPPYRYFDAVFYWED